MIWVVGSRGMLGRALLQQLMAAGAPCAGSDRDVDITDQLAVERFVTDKPINWIVNCAAYTAVDAAEDEPEACFAINSHGARVLAVAASSIGARFVHISTDYVFDGNATRPCGEDDTVRPVGVYAKSKTEGEMAVRQECARSFIIRTAWLYGANGKNFPLTMLKLLAEKDVVRVVNDQFGSPTWVVDLAAVIRMLVDRESADFGTYHYTNEGVATWYELAVEISERAVELGLLPDRRCRIEPISTAAYPTRAVRPAYSVLSKDKIKRTFGLEIPHWKVSLRSFLMDAAGSSAHSRRGN